MSYRKRVNRPRKKNLKTKGAPPCQKESDTSANKALKWPRVPKRRGTRLFVVSPNPLKKDRRADARARAELKKFWTD